TALSSDGLLARGEPLEVADAHHGTAGRRERDGELAEPELQRELRGLDADHVVRVQVRHGQRVEGDLDGLADARLQEPLSEILGCRVRAYRGVLDDLDEVPRRARATEPERAQRVRLRRHD